MGMDYPITKRSTGFERSETACKGQLSPSAWIMISVLLSIKSLGCNCFIESSPKGSLTAGLEIKSY